MQASLRETIKRPAFLDVDDVEICFWSEQVQIHPCMYACMKFNTATACACFLTSERTGHSKTSDITSLMKQQKEQFNLSEGYRPSATSHIFFRVKVHLKSRAYYGNSHKG